MHAPLVSFSPPSMARRFDLVLFEDALAHSLAPISSLRPAWDVKVGARTLREKLEDAAGRAVDGGIVRELLRETATPVAPTLSSDETLFVNGRAIVTKRVWSDIAALPTPGALTAKGTLVALRVARSTAEKLIEPAGKQALAAPKGVPTIETDARMIDAPWDTVRYLADELPPDIAAMQRRKRVLRQTATVKIAGKHRVTVDTGTRIHPYVVIDATDGPVHIGAHAEIRPFVHLVGPCAIGDHAIVKSHATVTGSAIGAWCRASGEISASIIHAFVNKQHEGFLGHSYLAPWVNLGAGTVTSNLKNTYGMIRVDPGDGTLVETGMQFLGTIAGDHTKTAINTTLNTGTILGVATNVFGGLPPKSLPPFSWGVPPTPFDIDKAVSLARAVMARRGVALSPVDERLLRALHARTVPRS